MVPPQTDLVIDRLEDAIRTSFKWIVERDRAGEIRDLAEAWTDLLASGLQDVRLSAPPMVDHNQPFLPFIETHRIRTSQFYVGRSGMKGGPTIDVLFQLWFDTEDVEGGFGVPVVMRKIPNFGPMPEQTWNDLRATCRKLNVATPSGRLVLFPDNAFSDWEVIRFFRHDPVIVMNAHSFASLLRPPRPVSGRLFDHFCRDLASGWIGDPVLSGRDASPVLDELLSNFYVSHVLRIRIEKDAAPKSAR